MKNENHLQDVVAKMRTPAVFHILLALADGDKHGYAIMQDVANTTEGALNLGPGTLYGAIKRMLAVRIIEESDKRPDPALDDERRRYYRLTPEGRYVLKTQVHRLGQLIEVARSRGLAMS